MYGGEGWPVVAVRGNLDGVGSDQNDPPVSNADTHTLSGRVDDLGKTVGFFSYKVSRVC